MNVLGSFGTPYGYSTYQQMTAQGTWIGGWVELTNHNKVYITAEHSIEQNNETASLGSLKNPFSETAYNEMMAAMTWPGGHVQHGSGVQYHYSYEEQLEASCYGSGSGSGSESFNCHVQGGIEEIMTIANNHIKISLIWNTGYTRTSPLSYLTISTTASSPYMEVSNNLSARWENGYTVMILGTYEYKTNNTTNSIILSLDGCTYDIPEIYRN